MEPQYDHQKSEEKVYSLWEQSGFFNPDKLPKSLILNPKSSFCVVMPPPNANGALHIGHALFVTLQDIMTRFNRMRGKKTLWLPGADHAGFETQTVYDKKLEKEGKNRFQIPRNELYKEMYAFSMENKKIMENQLKKLGASCDWSRETFTLDPEIVEEVQKTFVKMHEDGLIYRGLRTVNWCVKHQTALSGLEVKHKEEIGKLYYLKYGPFTLATARPETKFGDTAVAVHPNDKRYKTYIGREIEVEGLLGTFKIKIIGDKVVDPKFGTGVLKVTPAHDPKDAEIGARHNLEIKQVIDRYGKLNELTGPYAGMKVLEAREKIVENLKAKGLLIKIDENYTHNLAVCYKCERILEPIPLPQWYIKTKPLAKPAIEAVEKNKIKIIPERQKKVLLHWLKNIEDWNISRQIVWGIQIPAWFCENTKEKQNNKSAQNNDTSSHDALRAEALGNGARLVSKRGAPLRGSGREPQERADRGSGRSASCEPIIALQKPSHCPSCKSTNLTQDPDVFDTWFSSGQWPYLTLGWKNNGKHSKDFKDFYPTSVMETGSDILFFWVARMLMLGIYRTGKIPFKTVYLHGLVRDKDKQKMSKSRGNVIDPLGVAEEFGTDAVRAALVAGNTPGTDTIISEDKIRGYRNFTTKLWNIARFVSMQHSEGDRISFGDTISKKEKIYLKALEVIKKKVTKHLEAFEFHLALETVYHYIWHEFADKIIEETKPRLQNGSESEKEATRALLKTLLQESIKMLHPFMPFVTEEIYQELQFKEIVSPKEIRSPLLMTERW